MVRVENIFLKDAYFAERLILRTPTDARGVKQPANEQQDNVAQSKERRDLIALSHRIEGITVGR
jgi:hypothetical protein